MTLPELTALFANAGCRKLYAKPLSENDNKKNQIYFAGAVEALNIFPAQQVFAANTKRGPSFKARLDFGWLQDSGLVAPAPGAQLILYSQYPEVRFSGFLRGCGAPPSKLMAERVPRQERSEAEKRQLEGRILFLGVTAERRVVGYVAAGNSEVATEFRTRNFQPTIAVFSEVPLPNVTPDDVARARLLNELRRINRLGWIDSKQLDSAGQLRPCNAPQCGGFTLEAELGIPKNSDAEPDFLGWEVKQHSVGNLQQPDSGSRITLMTPEPTGGFYKEFGPEAFVRKFGYADKLGRADRLNFGGVHKIGVWHSTTNLVLRLTGYDQARAAITDANGAMQLVNAAGEIAAAWSFSGLLAHWSRKHTKAVYVPSQSRKDPHLQYTYGPRVRLAERTDSLKLLKALASGEVYYDPAVKVEFASTKAEVKRRNQFRVPSKCIGALYEKVELVDL